MKKRYRLLKNWDFKKVIDKGFKIENKQFIIYYLKNNYHNIRIGISVPKKTFKKSYLRNKIKRQVNHMLRMILVNNVKDKLLFDFVIIIRKDYLNNNFQFNFLMLKHQFNKLFKGAINAL